MTSQTNLDVHPALLYFGLCCFSSSQAAPTRATHTRPSKHNTHTLCSNLKYQGLLSNTLLMVSSTNGFIFAHINTHAATKRSCSPLFLRKLAENLLNPSLLPLLCCASRLVLALQEHLRPGQLEPERGLWASDHLAYKLIRQRRY